MADQISAASCTGAANRLSILRRGDRAMATLPPSASTGGDAGRKMQLTVVATPCCERNGWSAHHGDRAAVFGIAGLSPE